MATIPMSLPVQVGAKETNISFTHNENGYFMNLALKLEIPVQDLVDSLILCGQGFDGVLNQLVPDEPLARLTSTPACVSPLCSLSLSECGSTTCDPTPESYSMKSFPKIDSPYRTRGSWESTKATYFLREHKRQSKKQLSADAPVFTPSFPMASPYSQCSVAASADELWELPGPDTRTPTASLQPSILQRGLSNQCRQM